MAGVGGIESLKRTLRDVLHSFSPIHKKIDAMKLSVRAFQACIFSFTFGQPEESGGEL
jgi:hypothetical protein